jgi:hypothetical protein
MRAAGSALFTAACSTSGSSSLAVPGTTLINLNIVMGMTATAMLVPILLALRVVGVSMAMLLLLELLLLVVGLMWRRRKSSMAPTYPLSPLVLSLPLLVLLLVVVRVQRRDCAERDSPVSANPIAVMITRALLVLLVLQALRVPPVRRAPLALAALVVAVALTAVFRTGSPRRQPGIRSDLALLLTLLLVLVLVLILGDAGLPRRTKCWLGCIISTKTLVVSILPSLNTRTLSPLTVVMAVPGPCSRSDRGWRSWGCSMAAIISVLMLLMARAPLPLLLLLILLLPLLVIPWIWKKMKKELRDSFLPLLQVIHRHVLYVSQLCTKMTIIYIYIYIYIYILNHMHMSNKRSPVNTTSSASSRKGLVSRRAADIVSDSDDDLAMDLEATTTSTNGANTTNSTINNKMTLSKMLESDEDD